MHVKILELDDHITPKGQGPIILSARWFMDFDATTTAGFRVVGLGLPVYIVCIVGRSQPYDRSGEEHCKIT